MNSNIQPSRLDNHEPQEKLHSKPVQQKTNNRRLNSVSKQTSQKDLKDNNQKSNNDISNSYLGLSISSLYKGIGQALKFSKYYLESVREFNNQEVSTRHGFIQSAKQNLKYENNLARDFFLNISQFYDIIENQDDNELEILLPSYDLKYWQPIFRQALINWTYSNLTHQNAVVGITLEQTFLEFNSKKFVVKKGINIMKSFDVSSTLLQSVVSLGLKLKDKEEIKLEQKMNKIWKMFYQQRTEELLDKYSKHYKNFLKALEREKESPQKKSIKSNMFEMNETIFKDTNIKTLNQLRRQNQLKILVVKFHCIMIRCYYLQVSYHRRDLAQQPHYALKNELQKFISLINKQKNDKDQGSQETKKNLQDLDKSERLVFEIGEVKKILKEYEDDTISMSHVNRSMYQFQKLIKQHDNEIFLNHKDQFFKIESKIQQTLSYLEFVIVAEVRYIENQALIPRKFQESIQFLFNRDDLFIFLQMIDSIMVELCNKKVYQDEIPTLIKTKVPQIKILLSYPNQTSFILNKLIDNYHQYFQNSLKKRQKGEINHQLNLQKKQWQQIWHKKIKDIFNHMAFFNYVTISYQFSKQEPFHLNYFCINEGITRPIRYHSISSRHTKSITRISKHVDNKMQQLSSISSKTLNKLDFFWKTFQKPQILLRIYENSTFSIKEIKLIRNNGKLIFQTLYAQSVDINEIRQYKVRYLVHFSQFFLQIISDLSSAQNSSLAAIFNVCRFLILNFISFFYIQSFKRIEKEIKDKHGDFYYQLVKNEIKTNKRILDNKEKVADAIRLSADKIKRYYTEAKTEKNPSTNAKKMARIFSQFKSIKVLFEKLNCQQPIRDKVKLKNPEDAFKMEYDFNIVRQSYLAVVRIMTNDYLTKSVLQRVFKKIIPITQDQLFFVIQKVKESSLMKECAQFQQTFKKTDQFKLFMETETYDSLQCYQVYFQKFALTFLQMAKLTTMILSMPFYSYENEVQYMRKRRLDKEDLKKFEKQKSKILYSLDALYIYQRQRINCEFMKKHMKNFQLINIFGNYMKNVNDFFVFMRKQQNFDKLKFVKKQQNINIETMLFRNPKYLHNDIMSIYSKSELGEFFFQFNKTTQKFSPFKLEPNLRRSLQQFFVFCDKMGKKGLEICMEIKKKYDRLNAKKGNFGQMNELETKAAIQKNFGKINEVKEEELTQFQKDKNEGHQKA